jgi:1-deoxy-D-xylulose-5-phosphate reductoisomerase
VVSDGSPADAGAAARHPKRLSILGATGSIGASTLSLIRDNPSAFDIEAVTANGNAAELAKTAREVNARLAVVADPARYDDLKSALSGTGIEAAAGPDALRDAARRPVDLLVAAIVGAAGLEPTFAAISAGTRVALANKECMVSAGTLFMRAAREKGVEILPVDSEHNAIFQLIAGRPVSEIERIGLTASGGPFRTTTLEAMRTVTPAQALRHPKWSMGAKISIDSATLMNKGLELIEAHHLFGIAPDAIDVLVHPQSIVHGLAVLRNGYTLAAMSPPDMRTPIAHCLGWPDAVSAPLPQLDLFAVGRLDFEPPDIARFPALRLAREALAAGGWATNMLSAANEVAVAAFLAGGVGFLEIARIAEETLDRASANSAWGEPSSVDEALAIDASARRLAAELVRSAA